MPPLLPCSYFKNVYQQGLVALRRFVEIFFWFRHTAVRDEEFSEISEILCGLLMKTNSCEANFSLPRDCEWTFICFMLIEDSSTFAELSIIQ